MGQEIQYILTEEQRLKWRLLREQYGSHRSLLRDIHQIRRADTTLSFGEAVDCLYEQVEQGTEGD